MGRFLLENIRGILSLCVVLFIRSPKFAQVSLRYLVSMLKRLLSAGRFSLKRRSILTAFSVAAIVGVVGCGGSEDAPRVKPESPTVIQLVSSGQEGGMSWRVSVVRMGEEFCLQKSVNGIDEDPSCPPDIKQAPPVNFAVDGTTAGLVLVYGTVSESVSRLLATSTKGIEIPVSIVAPGGVAKNRYFAFGAKAGEASDLKAFDAAGAPIAVSSDKIRDAQVMPTGR